jgi:lipoprotein LpqH
MRIVSTAAALAVLALAGCSSSPPPQVARAGSLLLGTAQVTVNDADAGLTDQVACTSAGNLVTITTGTGDSGVTALVSTDGGLSAQAVSIRNLGGFTGSFNAGLGGKANVTSTGRSYEITGTADGFAVSQPSFRTSGDFTINVAC